MKDQWFVSCREMADKAVEVRASYLCSVWHILNSFSLNTVFIADFPWYICNFITTQCYVWHRLWCLSICLLWSGIVSTWLNISSKLFH